MRCGVRWTRCTVRNKRRRIEKRKTNKEIAYREHRDRKKAPGSVRGFFFCKEKGAPSGLERLSTNQLQRLFVVAGIAASAAFRRGGGAASAAGGSLLLLLSGFLDEGFARKADFVAFNGEHLDQNLVA
jgi:hypothetical protein